MLAILFYKDTANPDHVPGMWPCEIKTLQDGDQLPEAPWELWNELEYEAYMNEPSIIAAKEEWNIFHKGGGTVVYQTVAKGVITDVTLVSGYFLKRYDYNTHRVYILPNSVLKFKIEMRTLQDQLISSFTDLFMLPLSGELQATRLIAVQFFNGVAEVNVKFTRGLYEVTESLINRELPPDFQIAFDGLRVYVVETSAN